MVSPPQACFLFHPLLCQDPNKHKHTKTKTPKKLNRGYDKYKILTILAGWGGGGVWNNRKVCKMKPFFQKICTTYVLFLRFLFTKKKRSKQCQRHNGPNTAAGKNANSAKKSQIKDSIPLVRCTSCNISAIWPPRQPRQAKQTKQNKTLSDIIEFDIM